MTRPNRATRLDVASVVAHGSLRTVTTLYAAAAKAVIDGVVIVTDLETIRRVPPNTVVVLSAHMGSGGWQVSAALRHAWERRASAVIIPYSTYAESVISLAERLDINLMAAEQDPSTVALALAAEIGAVKSVAEVDLAQFARAVTRESTVSNVLKTISYRLGTLRVTLEHDGTVLAAAGGADRDGVPVHVDLPAIENWVRVKLVALVPKIRGYGPDEVRTFLEVAAPSVQAAWMAGEINDMAASAPTLALAELSHAVMGDAGTIDQVYPNLLATLGWHANQSYVAVWISHPRHQPHRVGRTAIVRLLWRKVWARRPLAEVLGGWLSVIPVSDEEGPGWIEIRIREKIGSSLAELGFSAGTSRRQSGIDDLPAMVQEARVAAEYGIRVAPGAVTSFGQLGVGAVLACTDDAAVTLVAGLTLPELLSAPDRDQIIRDTLAFLDNQSSMTLAAKSLKLHRNTLQQRMNRVRDVGIHLDDPAQLLPIHIILTVLKRGLRVPDTD
ncbi:PucR family transcriptional regulator [Arthrobacter wenxiniae]|jgi:hypothetical protein|uniref:PucR family transcriptional regulator n=1 Tax=Arthrobacter wenxiniae TaxID=2713570 RepID=A0A7Y7LZP5_9MICC|nr:helix-turn-helix domain-containing protein [Arthrobacter wenxiniae]NVM96202.1 PucR family transcriptional regulator [Arthrobacter wenxiniae]